MVVCPWIEYSSEENISRIFTPEADIELWGSERGDLSSNTDFILNVDDGVDTLGFSNRVFVKMLDKLQDETEEVVRDGLEEEVY